MSGSLNDILPDPISEENEQIILDMLKRKMKGAANMGVRLLHAMEERFGSEARQVVQDMITSRRPPNPEPGDPEDDLHNFCAALDKGCVGSHQWNKIIDEPDRVSYNYTRCMWAEIYRELGEPELGYVICAGDEPAIRARNPKLGFKRTKVLMNGDELCDHVFHVEK
ncbi:L-2-amino-thiazoline-4-carboxylic acid hydrolase [Candidatus Hydrogenedentota bacterium]